MAHKITCLECGRYITLYKRGLCWKCASDLEMVGMLDAKYPPRADRLFKWQQGDLVREKFVEYPLWGVVCRTSFFDGLWYGKIHGEPRVGVALSVTECLIDLDPNSLTAVSVDEYIKRLRWLKEVYEPMFGEFYY